MVADSLLPEFMADLEFLLFHNKTADMMRFSGRNHVSRRHYKRGDGVNDCDKTAIEGTVKSSRAANPVAQKTAPVNPCTGAANQYAETYQSATSLALLTNSAKESTYFMKLLFQGVVGTTGGVNASRASSLLAIPALRASIASSAA